MEKIKMPLGAKRIIDELYENGNEAFIVGGCVRDSLLSKEPYDFDITTSALPETIKAVFEKTVDTGIKHGTVTVIEGGIPYEVTTYRIDGEYKDNRHPVSVTYTENLTNDLARRDFTVNAMAYNDRVGLVDVFGGKSDLSYGIIRAVGDAKTRFSEDALRILRAIRFSSVLDFDIEEKTASAIHAKCDNLKDVSAERIYTEWKKLLSGRRAYDVISEYSDVISVFIPELDLSKMPPRAEFDELDPEERQIALFACSSLESGFVLAADRLKFDNKTKKFGIAVLKKLTLNGSESDTELRKYLLNTDEGVSNSAAKICSLVNPSAKVAERRLINLQKEVFPRKIADLAVNGNDLMKIGIYGKNIKTKLDEILYLIAEEKISNDKNEIISYLNATV